MKNIRSRGEALKDLKRTGAQLLVIFQSSLGSMWLKWKSKLAIPSESLDLPASSQQFSPIAVLLYAAVAWDITTYQCSLGLGPTLERLPTKQ